MIISLILAVAFMLIALGIIQRQFPQIKTLKRWGLRAVKATARLLWRRYERSGGARSQNPQIRFRR